MIIGVNVAQASAGLNGAHLFPTLQLEAAAQRAQLQEACLATHAKLARPGSIVSTQDSDDELDGILGLGHEEEANSLRCAQLEIEAFLLREKLAQLEVADIDCTVVNLSTERRRHCREARISCSGWSAAERERRLAEEVEAVRAELAAAEARGSAEIATNASAPAPGDSALDAASQDCGSGSPAGEALEATSVWVTSLDLEQGALEDFVESPRPASKVVHRGPSRDIRKAASIGGAPVRVSAPSFKPVVNSARRTDPRRNEATPSSKQPASARTSPATRPSLALSSTAAPRHRSASASGRDRLSKSIDFKPEKSWSRNKDGRPGEQARLKARPEPAASRTARPSGPAPAKPAAVEEEEPQEPLQAKLSQQSAPCQETVVEEIAVKEPEQKHRGTATSGEEAKPVQQQTSERADAANANELDEEEQLPQRHMSSGVHGQDEGLTAVQAREADKPGDGQERDEQPQAEDEEEDGKATQEQEQQGAREEKEDEETESQQVHEEEDRQMEALPQVLEPIQEVPVTVLEDDQEKRPEQDQEQEQSHQRSLDKWQQLPDTVVPMQNKEGMDLIQSTQPGEGGQKQEENMVSNPQEEGEEADEEEPAGVLAHPDSLPQRLEVVMEEERQSLDFTCPVIAEDSSGKPLDLELKEDEQQEDEEEEDKVGERQAEDEHQARAEEEEEEERDEEGDEDEERHKEEEEVSGKEDDEEEQDDEEEERLELSEDAPEDEDDAQEDEEDSQEDEEELEEQYHEEEDALVYVKPADKEEEGEDEEQDDSVNEDEEYHEPTAEMDAQDSRRREEDEEDEDEADLSVDEQDEEDEDLLDDDDEGDSLGQEETEEDVDLQEDEEEDEEEEDPEEGHFLDGGDEDDEAEFDEGLRDLYKSGDLQLNEPCPCDSGLPFGKCHFPLLGLGEAASSPASSTTALVGQALPSSPCAQAATPGLVVRSVSMGGQKTLMSIASGSSIAGRAWPMQPATSGGSTMVPTLSGGSAMVPAQSTGTAATGAPRQFYAAMPATAPSRSDSGGISVVRCASGHAVTPQPTACSNWQEGNMMRVAMGPASAASCASGATASSATVQMPYQASNMVGNPHAAMSGVMYQRTPAYGGQGLIPGANSRVMSAPASSQSSPAGLTGMVRSMATPAANSEAMLRRSLGQTAAAAAAPTASPLAGGVRAPTGAMPSRTFKAP